MGAGLVTVVLEAVKLLKFKSCGKIDAIDVGVGIEDAVLDDKVLVDDRLEVEDSAVECWGNVTGLKAVGGSSLVDDKLADDTLGGGAICAIAGSGTGGGALEDGTLKGVALVEVLRLFGPL